MTPTQQTLLDLAARVEGATGADRELDALIWQACVPGATRKETRYTHKASGKECVIDETRENGRLIVVPSYTASLDAAMSLVPKWLTPTIVGHDREVRLLNGVGLPVGGNDHRSVACTLPLALTAAALRARAQCAEVVS